MNGSGSAPREVVVPAAVFRTLRRELAREAGPLPTIHGLHAAGYAAGVEAARAFPGASDLSSVTERAFWANLDAFVARRGWGTLRHEQLHPAVGVLKSPDWVEAPETTEGEDASCSFTAGFLSGLLTTLAGGPVAVLEVACRGRGDATCDFAFGSETAIHEVYGLLLEGADLSGALAAL